MTVKYDADLEQAIPDLEVVRLRAEVAELQSRLNEANAILEENGLADAKPKEVTPAEKVCHQQIAILAQISDRGLPLTNEDIRNLDILVKALLAIQGKSPVPSDSSKKKKKQDEVKVADLLAIVKNNNE